MTPERIDLIASRYPGYAEVFQFLKSLPELKDPVWRDMKVLPDIGATIWIFNGLGVIAAMRQSNAVFSTTGAPIKLEDVTHWKPRINPDPPIVDSVLIKEIRQYANGRTGRDQELIDGVIEIIRRAGA